MNIFIGLVGAAFLMVVTFCVAHQIIDDFFPPHEHDEWWLRVSGRRRNRK